MFFAAPNTKLQMSPKPNTNSGNYIYEETRISSHGEQNLATDKCCKFKSLKNYD